MNDGVISEKDKEIFEILDDSYTKGIDYDDIIANLLPLKRRVEEPNGAWIDWAIARLSFKNGKLLVDSGRMKMEIDWTIQKFYLINHLIFQHGSKCCRQLNRFPFSI